MVLGKKGVMKMWKSTHFFPSVLLENDLVWEDDELVSLKSKEGETHVCLSRGHNPRGGSRGYGENLLFFEIVLLRRSIWRWWRRKQRRRRELLSESWFSSFVLFGVCLERGLSVDLMFSTWRFFIGWRKTLVLRQLLIECFLIPNITRFTKYVIMNL